MNEKEKLLAIKTFQEYKTKEKEFRNLPEDDEVLSHLSRLVDQIYEDQESEGFIGEVYKIPRHYKKNENE